jgi:alkylation response protein AidB-like acyl-CoA dehydrogenase
VIHEVAIMTPAPHHPVADAPGPDTRSTERLAGVNLEGHRLAVAREFTRMVDAGELELPLPGSGDTRGRWHALTAIAERDLALARLAEGHTDALAILAELEFLGVRPVPVPQPGSRWGVWAAEPPGTTLKASRSADGTWLLNGTKAYCSGARVCTHALVTVRDGDQRLLFAVPVGPGIAPNLDSWPATGMNASDTLDLEFDSVPATPMPP